MLVRPLIFVFVSFLGFHAPLNAAEETMPAPPLKTIELGISLQTLIPNILPNFSQAVPAYGPLLALSLGGDQIEFHAIYGTGQRISLFLTELNYRYNIPTPFIQVYATAGAGFLHYGAGNDDYNYFLPEIGLGISAPLAKDFKAAVGMKIYLPEKTLLNFGGQFTYSL